LVLLLSIIGIVIVHYWYCHCPLLVLSLSIIGIVIVHYWYCHCPLLVLSLSIIGIVIVHYWYCHCPLLVLSLSINCISLEFFLREYKVKESEKEGQQRDDRMNTFGNGVRKT